MAVFPARDSDEPFVGRERELTIGTAALTDEDRLGLVLISGEAGLGKSRLAERLIDTAGSPTVVRAVAVPRPTPIPFELVDGLGGPDEAGAAVGSVAERIRTAAEALRNLADGPTVFLFEDVHWADPESLEVIDRLAAAGPLGASIVVTFRPTGLRSDDAASSFLRRTERRADAVQLRLEPLRRHEVAAYLEASGRASSESTVDHIHARTGGNPLLLAELVAATDASADLTTGIPWTLAELLRPQIEALDPDVRCVAEAVAVLGSAIDFDLLAAAVEADEASLLRRLRTLVDLGILAEVEDDHFSYRHDLVREAVAESLFSRERRRFHGLVHDALVAAGSTDTVALVTHARAAGRHTAAAAAARDGAAVALDRGHTHHAFTFADQALEEFDDDAELHRVAVVSGWMTGQARAARQHLERWEELVGDDQERLAEVLHYRVRLLWEAGDRTANDVVAELDALAARLPDGPARAQAYADIAQHHMLVDQVEHAITAANRAIAVAEATGPSAAGARRQAAVECESARLAIADLRADAANALDRLAIEAEAAGDHVTASRAWHNRPLPADPVAADRQLERMRENGRRGGLTTISDVGHRYYLLTAAAASGDRETYTSLLDAALQDFDDPYELTMHAALLAIGDGRFDDAATFINAQPRGGRSPGKTIRWRDAATALLTFARGDTEPIRTWIETRRSEPNAAHLINHVVGRNLEALLASGLGGPIRDTLAALRAGGHGDAVWDAVIAEVDGRDRDADELYAAAIASPFARHVVERAQLHLGRARVASAPGAAEAHLAEAAQTLSTWPCPLADEICSRLSAPAPTPDSHGLTPREREVASLVARGLTNGGIADELFISTKTASVHVSNILSKLGMGNRTEIAAWVAAGSMN